MPRFYAVTVPQPTENRSRGCLESPCEASEPPPLRARHTRRRLPGEPTQHQPAHGQINHGFAAHREVLVVFTQTAIAANLGHGAFHHPAIRQDGEGWHGPRLEINRVPALVPRALHDC